ncbi:hypothetical protein Sru01_48760 [Sphaerisporangium rufum]|uniref:Uncharacterized protein n=1 Tax=Sphaerisporangium rufum TaxID=1381558 RepID=A0A919R5I9_9ACTN|nr:hypothetical protein Sru01_48760 [Sphaerisporangium rufum]
MVPASAPRHKVLDIRSARRRRTAAGADVVHLQAYTGRNVIRFPRPGGGTPAA